jgi:Ca2+-binding RTX toxin-like protein
MAGGAGDDYFFVDASGDVVVENVDEGHDLVLSSVSHSLAANVEDLVLYGTAIDGIGNELANDIAGNDAANTLDGREGADTLEGGAGDDTYLVDDEADAVSEAAGAGVDLVRASVSVGLGAPWQ